MLDNQDVYEENKQVEADSIKCEACGSNLVFDPDTQSLKCPHCGTEINFESNSAQEILLGHGLDNDKTWTADEAVVFRCDNCGAKVIMNPNETANFCPFCGTAHVQKIEELAGIKPNAVIPFTFNYKSAIDFSKKWAKKRFYAPRKFKKNICTDNVKGVYTPCFTFDSRTFSYYQGRIGKTHTRVVGSGKNRRVQTYVVWRNISGTYSDSFDDVLITAGSKFGQKELDKVSPYKTNESREYEENYLFGFMAYHYDSEITECWNDAKSRIDEVVKKSILSQYVHDVVDYINISTTHSDVTYKYVMLPVYIGNYKYNKKHYNFFVNGSTGKVYGKTPKSILKILGTVLLGIAVIAGIVLLTYLQ